MSRVPKPQKIVTYIGTKRIDAEEPFKDGEKTPDGKVKRKKYVRKSRRGVELAQPITADEMPPPPDWLRNNVYTLECWESVVAVLAERKQLSKDNYYSLLGLCQCYADWHRLRAFLTEFGSSYNVPNPVFQKAMENGMLEPEALVSDPRYMLSKRRPEVAEFTEVDRRFKMWLTEFGLTDQSRNKIKLHAKFGDKALLNGTGQAPTDDSEAAEDYGL